MISTTVRIDGADELRRAIRRLKDRELGRQLRETNLSAAQIVATEALPYVPVRTGRLKASVRALSAHRDATGVAGGGNVPYAAIIHWGGRGHHARPFLYDAAARAQSRVVDKYEHDIDILVRRVSARRV